MNIDDEHHQYDFITFSNLQSRQSAVIYPVYMLNKIVAHSLKAKNKEITIKYNIKNPQDLLNEISAKKTAKNGNVIGGN